MAYSLPSGLDPRTVPVIANYNFATEKWERLSSSYNSATNSVSAQLSHFSLYAPVSSTPTGTFPPTAAPETTPAVTPEPTDPIPTTTPAPAPDTTPTAIIPRSTGGGG
eukprot:994424-Rhodomonas_salina.1